MVAVVMYFSIWDIFEAQNFGSKGFGPKIYLRLLRSFDFLALFLLNPFFQESSNRSLDNFGSHLVW